jgi:integrase
LLPNPDKIGEHGHRPAMPYADVPQFMQKLKDAEGIAVNALAFTVLTASRTSEVIGATWDEVDFDAKVWTVPAERMKMAKAHDVPLSDEAITILRQQETKRRPRQTQLTVFYPARPQGCAGFFQTPVPDFSVFPGRTPDKPLSLPALAKALGRMGGGEFTVHGFRSSFRDFCGDSGVDFEIAEASLAHAIGNSASRAYLRSTK